MLPDMNRVLTVSRVTVAPENELEYVRTVQALAQLGAGRGQHLWLFRSTSQPHTYLEFSESRTEMSHRSRASRTDYELKLERRLQAIARYPEGAQDLWEEVLPAEPRPSSGWDSESEEEEEG
jgi:hypothetical protein